VSIRLNDLPDDGAAGEGDNVLGSLGGILGGSGDDTLESGPDAAGLVGGAGDDTLVGSPRASRSSARRATTRSRLVAAATTSRADSGRIGSAAVRGGMRRVTQESSDRCGSASATGPATAPRARATTSWRTLRT
jgi:hypothetical protein